LHEHLQVLITHEVPVGSDNSSQLVSGQVAVAIAIASLEGLMHAKLRPVAEALAKHLSLLLSCEVQPKSLHEQLPGLRHEEVRAAVAVLGVMGRSPLDLASHVLVVWCEGIAELGVENATVTIPVKPPDKEVDFILVRVRSLLSKGIRDFSSSHPAFACLIKHIESIHEVEVWLGAEAHFVFIYSGLKPDQLTEGSH